MEARLSNGKPGQIGKLGGASPPQVVNCAGRGARGGALDLGAFAALTADVPESPGTIPGQSWGLNPEDRSNPL
jgi:hypothetical protein